MKVKYYFKVSFKKPEMSESISQIIEKKSKLKSQLESCYSRLESIEICNSNSKPGDALILANYLIVDIVNFALLFVNQPKATMTENWKEKMNAISDKELAALFASPIELLEASNENEEEKSEKVETSLSELLYAVEQYVFKKNKIQFENPVDDYKKKSAVQLILSVIVIIFLISAGIKQYHKLKPIQEDIAKIYFMNAQAPTPADSNLITSKVKPSTDWLDATFVLPVPTEIKDIKVEPVHQRLARIQVKEIKYLDSNKKILYERNFKLNSLGIPANTEKNEICCMEDLKPGKLIPEKYLELESTNASPSFYVKIEPIKEVKEIVLSFRYIKNSKKFND